MYDTYTSCCSSNLETIHSNLRASEMAVRDAFEMEHERMHWIAFHGFLSGEEKQKKTLFARKQYLIVIVMSDPAAGSFSSVCLGATFCHGTLRILSRGGTNLVLITAQKSMFLIGKGHSCSGFNVHLDEDLTFTVTVFLVKKENHLILKFLPYCPNLPWICIIGMKIDAV